MAIWNCMFLNHLFDEGCWELTWQTAFSYSFCSEIKCFAHRTLFICTLHSWKLASPSQLAKTLINVVAMNEYLLRTFVFSFFILNLYLDYNRQTHVHPVIKDRPAVQVGGLRFVSPPPLHPDSDVQQNLNIWGFTHVGELMFLPSLVYLICLIPILLLNVLLQTLYETHDQSSHTFYICVI